MPEAYGRPPLTRSRTHPPPEVPSTTQGPFSMSDFTEVFRDDFNGSSLDRSTWKSLYSGDYGNGMFRWDPAQVEVGDGKLTIATERDGGSWVSGGLATIPDGQTYGSYEFSA